MRLWTKGLLCLFLALLALWMLSALVVGPESAQAHDIPEALPPVRDAAMLAYAIPAPENMNVTPPARPMERITLLALFCALAIGPTLDACRDANGRVIRTKRYVQSAYQMFRKEAASG